MRRVAGLLFREAGRDDGLAADPAYLDGVAPYEELCARWKALRGLGEVTVREVACPGTVRTLLAAEITARPGAPAIVLSAGAYVGEAGAAWALLSIARDGLLDRRFNYRIWCCTNPLGDASPAALPEARAIRTANRDRRFALAIDLREASAANGFECCEPGARNAGLASEVLAAVEAADLALDRGASELGNRYASYVPRRCTRRVLAFASPSRSAWDARIAMHRIATVAAIARAAGTFEV